VRDRRNRRHPAARTRRDSLSRRSQVQVARAPFALRRRSTRRRTPGGGSDRSLARVRRAEGTTAGPVLFSGLEPSSGLQFRDRLQRSFRFVLPDGELWRTSLIRVVSRRSPRSWNFPYQGDRHFPGAGSSPADVELRFPLLLKPRLRRIVRRNVRRFRASLASLG
jgi:hypothetical protein